MRVLAKGLLLLGALLAPTALGCGADVGAQGDVTSLFAKVGVRARVTAVQSSPRSRCALLEMPLDRNDVKKLIDGLNLTQAGSSTVEARSREIGAWVDEAIGLYEHSMLPGQGLEGMAPLAYEVFASPRRSPVLRLPSGSAFEYLILYWDPETDRALVQVSYAYG